MKKYLIILFVVFFSLIISSCGSGLGKDEYWNIPDNFVMSDYEIQDEVNLTCFAHDDNKYYNLWQNLVYDSDGVFNYFNTYKFLNTNNRIQINVPKGLDVEISLLNDKKEVVYSNVPNANGICYLFPNWSAYSYNVLVKYYDSVTSEEIVNEYVVRGSLNLSADSITVKKEIIDLMFVVDTTASMGDELDFLKNEINDVINRVSNNNNCKVNVGILLYKDKGEIYETLYSDFTSRIDEQVEFLNNKIAFGGGDYEEAVEVAIEEASLKSWSGSNSTKILIHIGDAPAHDENIEKWYNAVLDLCSKGVRIITVASSGITKKTEYLFRSMTLISNGTYVALTNDSNIGDEHMDPSVELDVKIEYLDDCLVRLISLYHTGRNN